MKRFRLSYLGNYRFNSIFFRNMMMLMAYALLPLILIIVITMLFYGEALNKDAATTSQMAVTYLEHSVERIEETVLAEIRRIVLDTDCIAFLSSKKSEDKENQNLSFDYVRLMSNLSSRVHLLTPSRNIYLYNRDIGLVGNDLSLLGDRAAVHPCIAAYDALPAVNELFEQFRSYTWVSAEGEFMLTYACPFISGKIDRGYVFISLSVKDVLRSAVSDAGIDQGSFAVVTDQQVVFTSGRQGRPDDEILIALSGESIPAAYSTVSVDGENSMVFQGVVFGNDFRLLYFLPQSAVLGGVAWLQTLSLALTVVVLLLSIALAFWISIRMYSPIRQLLETAGRMPAAQQEAKGAGDEITYIARTLDAAYERQLVAENELEERVDMFRNAQYVALQSQINPHFLCNTLDNINWLAIMRLGEDNEISEMCTGLARLLTVSMSTSSSVHKLSIEIEHAQLYIHIMQKRYVDRFTVAWHIEEGVSGVDVPKILLQPVLENAIYHGIKPLLDRQGIIDIRIARDGTLLRIEVEDNGPGFGGAEAQKLNEALTYKYTQTDEHIGLRNVNMRIKLLFGDAYGVSIVERGAGGLVVLQIPLK